MAGLIILIILLILLAVTLFRAAHCKASPAAERLPSSRNEEELEEMGHRFAKLIQVHTDSRLPGEDLSAFDTYHQVVDGLFPLCTKTLQKTVLDGVLLYHWKGKHSDLPAILMMGHQDTVPADAKNWKYPPYGGEIHEGKIYGRGVMDDKCNQFCQMSAIENLLKEGFVPERDVWLEYSVNEENSGPGAETAVQYLKEHGVKLACAWDEGGAVVDKAMAGMDRPYAVIGITEKGYADVKITAKGEGGHSSAPHATTTVTRLADFMHEVNHSHLYERKFTPHVKAMFENMAPSFSFPMRYLFSNLWLYKGLLTKIMGKVNAQADALLGTTICFTEMKGSDATNVIPSEAYVIANLRTGFTQDLKTSLAILKQKADKYDLELEVLSSREASPVTPQDSAVYQYLVSCIRKKFPDCGISSYVMTGGTDNRHFAELTENCLRFYPLRLTSQQLACMHSDNENADLRSLSDAIDFYQYFLENWNL